MTKGYAFDFKLFSLLLMAVFYLSSCEKYYDRSIEDYNFIQHNFDSEVDFSQYKTYSLPDTLNFIKDRYYTYLNIDVDSLTKGRYSSDIVSLVKSRLNQLGLKEVNPSISSTADLSVVINSMTVRQVSTYIYMPNYYDPNYGNSNWYYYYPWGVYSYATNNGTLSIDLVDLLNKETLNDSISKFESVWHSSYEGYIQNDLEKYTDGVLKGIDFIFDNDKAFK